VKDSPYYKQAELMLKTIPHVAAERSFALKGGTAINLFVRDMPRLLVDIRWRRKGISPLPDESSFSVLRRRFRESQIEVACKAGKSFSY